jgi:hypothetical protein
VPIVAGTVVAVPNDGTVTMSMIKSMICELAGNFKVALVAVPAAAVVTVVV